jgi:hypothetical protein
MTEKIDELTVFQDYLLYEPRFGFHPNTLRAQNQQFLGPCRHPKVYFGVSDPSEEYYPYEVDVSPGKLLRLFDSIVSIHVEKMHL